MQMKRGQTDFAAGIDANIARNVRSARERRGISQSELARRVTEVGVTGFHQTTIARIESGTRALRASEAIAVCEVLKVTFEMLAASHGADQLHRASEAARSSAAAFDAAVLDLLEAQRALARQIDASLAGVVPRDDLTPAELIDASNAVEAQMDAEDTLSATEPQHRFAAILRAELDVVKAGYPSDETSVHVDALRERIEGYLSRLTGGV